MPKRWPGNRWASHKSYMPHTNTHIYVLFDLTIFEDHWCALCVCGLCARIIMHGVVKRWLLFGQEFYWIRRVIHSLAYVMIYLHAWWSSRPDAYANDTRDDGFTHLHRNCGRQTQAHDSLVDWVVPLLFWCITNKIARTCANIGRRPHTRTTHIDNSFFISFVWIQTSKRNLCRVKCYTCKSVWWPHMRFNCYTHTTDCIGCYISMRHTSGAIKRAQMSNVVWIQMNVELSC